MNSERLVKLEDAGPKKRDPYYLFLDMGSHALWLSEVQVTLGIENDRAVSITGKRLYPLSTGFLALLAAVVCYLGARLGARMAVSGLAIAALWPPTALLVAAILLVPRRNWLVLVPAGLAGAAVVNLQLGLTLRATGCFS